MDKNYHEDVFSWHHIKIREFTSEGNTYLWVELDLETFKKCGFHDWKLYQIGVNGENLEVNKIVNISDNKKLGSQIKHKKNFNVKAVQGRIVVHPENSK